ncbi:MAG: hypothetical protein ACR2OH_00845 [Microthrixaceae bacterium]
MLGSVRQRIEDELNPRFGTSPGVFAVSCESADTAVVGRGTVLICDLVVDETRYPLEHMTEALLVVTADAGTVAYDTQFSIPRVHEQLGTGLFCRDLFGQYFPGAVELVHPNERSYLYMLAYWFEDGQPDRMDADLNGIPCETLYPSAVVDQVLGGGQVG